MLLCSFVMLNTLYHKVLGNNIAGITHIVKSQLVGEELGWVKRRIPGKPSLSFAPENHYGVSKRAIARCLINTKLKIGIQARSSPFIWKIRARVRLLDINGRYPTLPSGNTSSLGGTSTGQTHERTAQKTQSMRGCIDFVCLVPARYQIRAAGN
jgi:hypothetical protein